MNEMKQFFSNKTRIRTGDSTADKRKWFIMDREVRKIINWKYLAKFIVVISSFTGFFYQSSEYFVNYFEFPTFVNVRSERSLTIDIPSVTICIPSLTSRTNLMKTYPEINETINNIKSHNENSSAIVERDIFKLYESQSADSVTPQQFFGLGVHAKDIIECKVLKPQSFDHLNDTWIPCTEVSEVLETIGPNGKCFTYFTKLNQNETKGLDKKYTIDAYKSVRDEVGLTITLNLTINSSEYTDVGKMGDESITLHETTGVPTEGKRRRLKAGTTYDIFFEKILTTNLPKPYKTDCINYGVFDNQLPQSRVDCVDRCVKDIYYNYCYCYPLHVVVRHDIVISRNLSMCNQSTPKINQCKQREVQSRCFEKCNLDCNEITYEFDTEEDIYPSDKELEEAEDDEKIKLQNIRNFTAIIKLRRKYSGDTLYEYKPELPLVQLYSFVGGLASLWLGISIIAFYDILVKIVTIVYRTKPFEKMRRRDAAVSVLTNWAKNTKRRKLKIQPKITLNVKSLRLAKSPVVINHS